ncbi:MAG: transposase [Pseudomonadota bacterium]
MYLNAIWSIIQMSGADFYYEHAKIKIALTSHKAKRMPRKARLDAPGTLHHVIIRGIEKRDIVKGDKDRGDFVGRLGELSVKTGNAVMAWALMTNHAHILIKSGSGGISELMRRLLTGYAVSFNLRHRRSGHLFQNRYKSIVCQEDAYFKELVRYIHLNPLRAKMVAGLEELDRYEWSGHSVLMGKNAQPWMRINDVLKWFGKDVDTGRTNYRDFVISGVDQGRRPELVGGGLIRSLGGWSAVKAMRKAGGDELFDARILGDGDFVAQLMEETGAIQKRQFAATGDIESAVEFIKAECHNQRVSYQALVQGGRSRDVTSVRKKLAVELSRKYGWTKAETARQLGVTTTAIFRILERIEQDRQ